MSLDLSIDAFQPRSELITEEHLVPRPRFTVIDAHNHLRLDGDQAAAGLEEMAAVLDQVDVEAIVNLSGGTGDDLRRRLDLVEQVCPGRVITFCNVNWPGVGEPGWVDRATAQLRDDVQAGARGLKVFKRLGLQWRDIDGNLIMPDDARIADVWDQAGELGVPVLIHSADPVAFFRPLDRFNERWDELHRHPDWHFHGANFPSFEELIDALYRTIGAHPDTAFITAHVGCYPENLRFVSQMLDSYPNMYTDISARFAELGRVPYSARQWFIDYADRIVYGTDVSPSVAMYQNTFRFLETRDEYFDYDVDAEIPPQGRWKIYGVGLPDDVLGQVYRANAARLLNID